jgi:hypothetical protein
MVRLSLLQMTEKVVRFGTTTTHSPSRMFWAKGSGFPPPTMVLQSFLILGWSFLNKATTHNFERANESLGVRKAHDCALHFIKSSGDNNMY